MKFLTNIVKGLTIGFLLATTACQSEWEDLDLGGTAEAEVAGEVIEITYRGQSVTVRQVGDQYIADGDMILYPDSKKMEATNAKTAGVGVDPNGDAFSPDILWPNNTVPYTIDPELIATYERTGFRNPEVIREAMSHIAEETSVRFVERTSEEKTT